MQRMIVGLVLFLTAIVGILIVTVLNLSGQIEDRRVSRPPVAVRTADPEPSVGAEQVRVLETRLAEMQRLNLKLKDRMERVEREARLARAEARRAAAGDGSNVSIEDPQGSDGGLPALGEGGFDEVTEEQMERFVAIQKKVERKRRIAGMTRNVMRRIDRMVDKGEIGNLTPETRDSLEEKIQGFVASGDDLVTRYIRDPGAEIQTLSADERRDEMTKERDRIVAEAQLVLEPLVGEQDALAIAENSLQNPWGVRLRGGRRGQRGSDR